MSEYANHPSVIAMKAWLAALGPDITAVDCFERIDEIMRDESRTHEDVDAELKALLHLAMSLARQSILVRA
jgi:hypothetical protein